MEKSSQSSRRGIVFVMAAVVVALIGVVVWQQTGFDWHLKKPKTEAPEAAPPVAGQPAAPSASQADGGTLLAQWADVSSWKPFNLSVEQKSGTTSSGEGTFARIVEDSNDVWRNIQTAVAAPKGKQIKASVQVRGGEAERQAIVMMFSGPDRFSCRMNPATGATAERYIGEAKILSCTSVREPNGWWRLDSVGILPDNGQTEPTFLAVAMGAEDSFREDYKGDGKAFIEIGKVEVVQVND